MRRAPGRRVHRLMNGALVSSFRREGASSLSRRIWGVSVILSSHRQGSQLLLPVEVTHVRVC